MRQRLWPSWPSGCFHHDRSRVRMQSLANFKRNMHLLVIVKTQKGRSCPFKTMLETPKISTKIYNFFKNTGFYYNRSSSELKIKYSERRVPCSQFQFLVSSMFVFRVIMPLAFDWILWCIVWKEMLITLLTKTHFISYCLLRY